MNRTLFFVLVAAAMILAACGGAVAIGDVEKVAANAAATAVAEYAAANPPAVDPTATTATEETQTAEETTPTTPAQGVGMVDSGIPAVEGLIQYDGFAVAGFPERVEVSRAQMAEVVSLAVKQARGEADNYNVTGLGTEVCLADAGTYLTYDVADDERNESAWMHDSDTVPPLPYPATAGFIPQANLSEGGAMWITGDAHTTSTAGLTFMAYGQEAHSWFVIWCNRVWDHKIDTDYNLAVQIWDYNPGFVQVQRFPPGSFVSEDYWLDNVASAHQQRSSGSDGSTTVDTAVAVPNFPAGAAWVVVRQEELNGPFTLLGTNMVPTD